MVHGRAEWRVVMDECGKQGASSLSFVVATWQCTGEGIQYMGGAAVVAESEVVV